jgi:hypothetical protein
VSLMLLAPLILGCMPMFAATSTTPTPIPTPGPTPTPTPTPTPGLATTKGGLRVF